MNRYRHRVQAHKHTMGVKTYYITIHNTSCKAGSYVIVVKHDTTWIEDPT